MAKEVLDTLYIAFKASGVNEIRSLISNLEKDLDKFQKKINDVQLKSFKGAFNDVKNVSKTVGETIKRANDIMVQGARRATKAYASQAVALRALKTEFFEIAKISKSMGISLGGSGGGHKISGYGGKLSSSNLGNLNKFLKLQILKRQVKGQDLKNISLTTRAFQIDPLRMKAAEIGVETKKFNLEVKKRREDSRLTMNMEKMKRQAEKDTIIKGGGETTSIIGAVKGLAVAGAVLYAAGKALSFAVKTLQYGKAKRAEGAEYYNKLFLSGVDNAKARNAGVNIAKYGGTKEEILASLGAFSTSLGAMSRGDTSLVEHLGKYGIGGVNPNMTPDELIAKIKERVRRGDLGKNEINSLLAGVPLSEAGKVSIMEDAGDMFKGELNVFKMSERNREVLKRWEELQMNFLDGMMTILDKTAIIVEPVLNLAKKLTNLVVDKLSSPKETLKSAIKEFSGNNSGIMGVIRDIRDDQVNYRQNVSNALHKAFEDLDFKTPNIPYVDEAYKYVQSRSSTTNNNQAYNNYYYYNKGDSDTIIPMMTDKDYSFIGQFEGAF